MRDEQQTVYIVDDDPAIRQWLSRLMQSLHLTVQTFDKALDALHTLGLQTRGCLVLDVRMPGMSGLELQSRLQAEGIDLPIIFISAHGDIPMAVQAVQRGAFEFLEKPFREQEIVDCIQQALAHERQSYQHRIELAMQRERLGRLTARELAVLTLIVAGQPSKSIASELDLSEKTIEFHRSRIMAKLEVECLAQLVKVAVQAGLS